jgi:N-acetylglucosamine-6-phosphate deacetylase
VTASTHTSLLIRDAAPCDGAETGGLVDIVVAGSRIVAVQPAGGGVGPAARVLDAGGRRVIPGLIDLHVHGAGGADVMDGSADAVATASRTLARLGTTSYLATTFLRPGIGNAHLPVLAGAVNAGRGFAESAGARLLGIHLEGPFVSPVRRGGLPPDALLDPTGRALDEVLELTAGALRMMTIAPELPGGLGLIERLTATGVVASFGHSDADYDQTRAGLAAGINHVTHLYNAMRGLHHRDPGPLVALHEADGVTVQLIADDVHVDRRVIRWTREVFGHGRCVCVTDGIRTTGLPDGDYRLGGLDYSSRDGVARYADGTLIGTSLPLLEVARRFSRYTDCTLGQAVETASLHAARVLGIQDRKGSLEAGKDADIVLLDDDDSVRATVVEGDVVFSRAPADRR